MRRLVPLLAVFALAACGGGGSSGPPSELLHPAKLTAKAPQLFDIEFHTTKGDFVVTVHRTWAPNGADRLYNLAKNGFFDGEKFFRVVPGFVVQFGISPYPEVSKAWRDAMIPDDVVTNHNTRGTVSFASAGPNTRTTQIFVNLGDNRGLDNNGFAPVGSVVSGMKVLDKLYSGYGDDPTPHQPEMETQGNAWLEDHYPKLDSIETAEVANEQNPALP
ncbi:MAG TPA: peptidylprolyl isomerase [Gaiellaceae bacterium]|jgi:peptidyl-prolyl cis-trans isomerase A (cyclophilin A)|nr:peptidylprolyl isomerase [Gaiellaceae bacterium]